MRKHIERVFSAFETNLIPIIVAVLASYVLVAPAQFREIHRAFAQRLAALQTQPMTYDNPDVWSAATTSLYTLGGLIALSVLLWLSCRANFYDPNLDDPKLADRKAAESKVAPGALRLVSLSLAGLPFLGMAVGFYAASSSFGAVDEIKKLLTKIKESILLDTGFDPALAPAAAADWADKIASYNIILLGGAVVFVLLGLLVVFLLSRLEESARADAL